MKRSFQDGLVDERPFRAEGRAWGEGQVMRLER